LAVCKTHRPAANILVGVDLAQQARGKAVARYPPDLWNRDRRARGKRDISKNSPSRCRTVFSSAAQFGHTGMNRN